MKQLFKERFALTDQGTSDIIKASIASFFVYAINMIPAMLMMLFLDQLVLKNVKNNSLYIIVSIVILVVIYTLLNMEYNSLYNATFRESENMRIDIARTLSRLLLSYFSKHDLSGLAQTIMGDVAVIGFIAFFLLISIMLLSGNIKLGLAVILPILLNFSLIFL